MLFCFFFFKQKTAYELRISDWSSDVCSSDLLHGGNPIESICEARGRNLRRDHRPRLAIFSHCPNRTACDLRQTHHRIIRRPTVDIRGCHGDRTKRRGLIAFRFDLTFDRSDEHTSELQSLMRISYAFFCLKKKKTTQQT